MAARLSTVLAATTFPGLLCCSELQVCSSELRPPTGASLSLLQQASAAGGRSCPGHCSACGTTTGPCTACHGGYTREVNGNCARCGWQCDACDGAGKGFCDNDGCREGFTSRKGRCKSCGQHCSKCDQAGPGQCDQDGCRSGYRMHFGLCVWVPKISTGARVTEVGGLAVFVLLVCWAFPGPLLALARACAAPFRRSTTEPAPEPPPSGLWRGYYTDGDNKHYVYEHVLEFVAHNFISGWGVDNIGSFQISGRLPPETPEHMTFSKSYVIGSLNDEGQKTADNLGQTLRYHGCLLGGSLAAGFRGTWVYKDRYEETGGAFHLWPAMEAWSGLGHLSIPTPRTEEEPSAREVAGESTAPALQAVLDATQGFKCFMCFVQPISTCLVPCGHAALCTGCARKVATAGRCPLCNVRLQSMVCRGPGAQCVLACRGLEES